MQAQSPGVSAPVKTHAFTPALTWQQVEEHEARTDIGINRRIMLATLTRSSQELLDGFSENGDALLSAVERNHRPPRLPHRLP